MARSLALAGGEPAAAAAFADAQGRWADRTAVVATLRAAISASGRSDAAFTGEPVIDFLGAVRAAGLFGKLTAVRRQPPRVRIVDLLAGATAAWRGEGAAIRVSEGELAGEVLDAAPLDAMVVVSSESLARGGRTAEESLGDDLVLAVALASEEAFLDPANSGSTARPQAVTNAGEIVISTGADLESLDADLRTAIDVLADGGSDLGAAMWIMHPSTAARLATLRGSGGSAAYPGIRVRGEGDLLGIPQLTSSGVKPIVASPGTASSIVLLDQRAVVISETDAVDLRTTSRAPIEMETTPTGDSLSPTGAQLVSLFQADATAIAASRHITWRLRRSAGCVTIAGVSL